jgi:hypothetical protein
MIYFRSIQRIAQIDGGKAVLLYLHGESPWLCHKACAEMSIKRDGFGYDYATVANPQGKPCRICYGKVPLT